MCQNHHGSLNIARMVPTPHGRMRFLRKQFFFSDQYGDFAVAIAKRAGAIYVFEHN